MKFGIIEAGYKGVDLDLKNFAEVRAYRIAVIVLEEFARMVAKAVKDLGFNPVPEDGRALWEKTGENIETAVRLYLLKRGDLHKSSFRFDEDSTLTDGHADGGLLRAFLRLTPDVADVTTKGKEFFFEVMYDIEKKDMTLTVFGDPRNGKE